jgi:ribosomal protein S6--L-glutamate ligase
LILVEIPIGQINIKPGERPLKRKVIALESRLKNCRNVQTLGVRPNFSSYSAADTERIRNADIIYYPTPFYADLFDVAGKRTFPSYHTYKFVQDKIRQTALFQLLELSHPRTRVFYGVRQKQKIEQHFTFPMIGKIPRGSAMGKGVYLIENRSDLEAYCLIGGPAYIQEYLPIDRDIRVVIIGSQIVLAYWRVAPPDDFRSNVAVGGMVTFDRIPRGALNLALYAARCCRWDDVGIDICEYQGNYYILEANMKYGKEGFRKAGIDYSMLMEYLIEHEII